MEYKFVPDDSGGLDERHRKELTEAAQQVGIALKCFQHRIPQPDGTIKLEGGGWEMDASHAKLIEAQLRKNSRSTWKAIEMPPRETD